MMDLAAWLEANADALLEISAAKLSQNEALKAQVVVVVASFFAGLHELTSTGRVEPIQVVLREWVESRSTSIDRDVTSFVPVLASLKQAVIDQILASSSVEDAIELLIATDAIFIDMLVYLSSLETTALLRAMQNRLDTAQQEIQRLNKTKSDFIAIAAHELKTPLTVIEGYSGMIRSNPTAADDTHLLACLAGVEGGIKRLRDIVDDLVDVSMIDLKMIKLNYQIVWLRHLLDTLVYHLREPLDQRQLLLTVEWDTIPQQPIFADSERLMQVLRKVVMNAIKYTPDGGEIRITGRELPGFLDLTVADNGIGISAVNLAHIFDAFSALNNAALHSSSKVKFKGGGPGLGLPIAKGVIEAHGGSIWAQSPGHDELSCPGSTFHILIPMRETPPEDEQALPEDEQTLPEDEDLLETSE